MHWNTPKHVVPTCRPTGMPLQVTGQSEKLIVWPRWCAIVAQQASMAVPVGDAGCAILTHRFCHRADICNSRDIAVEGCFIRTLDDLVVVKTDKGQGEAHHIVAKDCVLWNE